MTLSSFPFISFRGDRAAVVSIAMAIIRHPITVPLQTQRRAVHVHPWPSPRAVCAAGGAPAGGGEPCRVGPTPALSDGRGNHKLEHRLHPTSVGERDAVRRQQRRPAER